MDINTMLTLVFTMVAIMSNIIETRYIVVKHNTIYKDAKVEIGSYFELNINTL